MARLAPYFPKSHGRPRVERNHLRRPQQPALSGCAGGLWAAQDALKSLDAME